MNERVNSQGPRTKPVLCASKEESSRWREPAADFSSTFPHLQTFPSIIITFQSFISSLCFLCAPAYSSDSAAAAAINITTTHLLLQPLTSYLSTSSLIVCCLLRFSFLLILWMQMTQKYLFLFPFHHLPIHFSLLSFIKAQTERKKSVGVIFFRPIQISLLYFSLSHFISSELSWR